jgi:hypothetical protein
MSDLVNILLFAGIWIALQLWVFPRLGVPT